MHPTDEIIALFHGSGDSAYFGEPVTQTEHALQTSWFASRAVASPALAERGSTAPMG